MLKTISLTAVKLAALLDIELNGSTTTLNVKMILREQNVDARQQKVSELMEQAAAELPLEFNTNGLHRTYTLPEPQNVASDADTDDEEVEIGRPVVGGSSNRPSYTKRDGTVVAGFKNASELSLDDWIVCLNDSDDDFDTIYFDSTYTRDEVRQAYANISGSKFWDVRARRYK